MRRLARELALQVLFEKEFASQSQVHNTVELSRDGSQALDPSILVYATELVDGVSQFKDQIDQKIQGASQHWKLDRMATVDRNIIRIAIFEMLYLKEPLKPNIVINEAVEIAKKFSTDESASFINGLLDQARTLVT
ncbi:MAG: transcription antitermination factor NusB [Bdellovibrionales bacterium]|jgi:N utilization substance protein B|nr:transcription antitermination factor NusB [Bdellovibrionales bacterium]